MAKKQKRISGPKRKQQKRKMGRPTKYSKALADRIINLAMDGVSTRNICVREDMPVRSTLFKFLDEHKDFSDRYTRARNFYLEICIDDLMDVRGAVLSSQLHPQQGKVAADITLMAAERRMPTKKRMELSGDEKHPLRGIVEHIDDKNAD